MRKATGKRIFAFVIAVAMIVTMFMTAMLQTFAYTESTGTVSNDNVKVRESASTSGSQVASLKKGDVIDIIGEEKDSSGYIWYKIRVNKNEQGYVRSDLVNKAGGPSTASDTNAEKKEEKASTPPAETQVTDVENKSASIGYDNVVIRKGAGKDYDSLDKGTKGEAVTITGEAKGTDGKTWYRITFGDGKEGFIRGDLVDTSGTAQPAPEPAPAPAETAEAPEATAAPEEGEGEQAESEEGESEEGSEDSEDSEEEEQEEAPATVGDGTYSLTYENDTWYLNDYSEQRRIEVKQLIDLATKAPAFDKQAKNFKLIAIGLGALAGILLIAVIILALKLRESMYYEDEEDEEEFERFSDSRRRRARDDEEEEENNRPFSRRERSSRDDERGSRRASSARAEASKRGDDERTVRPNSDDERTVRPSRNPEDRPARPRRSEEDRDRASRRSSDSRYDERPSRDSYRDEEREAPRRRAKNFIGDDDDFEFEFLDLDDEK
ncbi:SH3 domain-containing protein [Butyrivibrio sp. X503]|uniref:SH3 domain-containing protein n=1 Tax=Butyrivibrio sp. X503 TaxID=2364878 RepID=UPI001314DDC6|nr:SH3 domain-containing protein [Butyrivibrio sp. X503]